jgi:putative hemolysin
MSDTVTDPFGAPAQVVDALSRSAMGKPASPYCLKVGGDLRLSESSSSNEIVGRRPRP